MSPTSTGPGEMAAPARAGGSPLRGIRSFVRRDGRITRAQARAIETGWPRFGLVAAGRLDLDAIYGRRADRVLEIGFGMGDALLEMARRRPDRDFLGIDVYEPGVGRLLSRLLADEVRNVRVMRGDAAELLSACFEPGALTSVALFFPDPWPKKRHHKRRLVQPEFAELVASRLCPGGCFRLATDWADYAWQMLRVLEAVPGLRNSAAAGAFLPGRGERPPTKFERRGLAEGNRIFDLEFVRAA